MKIFNKTKKHIGQDEVAQQIANRILSSQSRIADYLNGKAKYLSGKSSLYALILFSAAFGGYCLYLVIISIK